MLGTVLLCIISFLVGEFMGVFMVALISANGEDKNNGDKR